MEVLSSIFHPFDICYWPAGVSSVLSTATSLLSSAAGGAVVSGTDGGIIVSPAKSKQVPPS